MNIACVSSSGMTRLAAVIPPSSEEYVLQSWLTLATSCAVVTDQNPASCG